MFLHAHMWHSCGDTSNTKNLEPNITHVRLDMKRALDENAMRPVEV